MIKNTTKKRVAAFVSGLVALCAFGSMVFFLVNDDNAELIENKNNLVERSGFYEANEEFKLQQIEEFKLQLNANQITPEEFAEKVGNLQELDVEEYMTSENVSPEISAEYVSVQEQMDDVSLRKIFGMLGSSVVVGTSLGVVGMLTQENGKKKELPEDDDRYTGIDLC